MKILFVLKDRFYNKSYTNSYGLSNSARHVAKYLVGIGNECRIASVIDGNYIDKEVYGFKPDLVIIEALWVTGKKMEELTEKYKETKWVIRIHSDIGFLSSELQAIFYINEYISLNKSNLYISFNNRELNDRMGDIEGYSFIYLPNIMTAFDHNKNINNERDIIDIGCFGALRFLKNQCYQAICAMKAADELKKKLRFHITVNFDTDSKNPVLINLEQLFKNSHHELVKHDWLDNDKFNDIIKEMDMGLQISYTESFNIVTADFVNNNILIIVSDAIKWMPSFLKTSSVDYDKTTRKIVEVYGIRNDESLKTKCRQNLACYNRTSKGMWKKFIEYIS